MAAQRAPRPAAAVRGLSFRGAMQASDELQSGESRAFFTHPNEPDGELSLASPSICIGAPESTKCRFNYLSHRIQTAQNKAVEERTKPKVGGGGEWRGGESWVEAGRNGVRTLHHGTAGAGQCRT